MLVANEPRLTGWRNVCGEELADNTPAIEARARAALEAHPHFHGRTEFVRCIYTGDTMRLEGCVPCFYLKQLAQEALMGIPGMPRVVNDIAVASPEGEVVDCEGLANSYRYDHEGAARPKRSPVAARPR